MELKLEKVFEDEALLVVNKPFGLIVNTAETTKNELTVSDWMQKEYQELFAQSHEEEFKVRRGVVHRLDKDTSGLLLLAKTSDAFFNLKGQFKERQVEKNYLALVHGKLEPRSGVVSVPIERNPFNRKRFGVFLGGREAVTHYQVVKNFDYQQELFSLVDVYPKTGRTHQIRVHLTHLGHPLVSDILYTGRKNLKSDLQFCSRMFLHAYFLSFNHPTKKEKLTFQIDLPGELKAVLKKFESV